MANLRAQHLALGQRGYISTFIRIEREGPVTCLTIERPEQRNALNAEAQFELAEAFDAFAADPDQWVAILTGSGDRSFCAGGDLKALARDGITERPKSGFGGLVYRYDLVKPVIAAVNGTAFGGGFELALACDLIVAADTARFALTEPRIGLAALGGGLQRLPRQIGLKRALDLILTARETSAEEGREMGFVCRVAPQDALMDCARELAQQICALAPLAVQASKEAVYRGIEEENLRDAFRAQRNYPAVQAMMASEDFREGPRAFAEHRPPRWKGR